jgi:hypothetical protein
MSGGLLAAVAVGALVALSEIDKKTNFIEKVVGEKAAPWVRLGIGVATTALGGLAAAGFFGGGANLGSAANTLQGATALVGGGSAVLEGVHTIAQASEQADDLRRQANLQDTLNRMQQMNRLVSQLLDTLGDENDDVKNERDLAGGIWQTQAATQSAAIMPA